MMKIAYSSVRFPPALGGVETYVAAMADVMANHGHDVAVVTSSLAQHLPGMRRELTEAELGSDRARGYEVARLRHRVLPRLEAYPFSLASPVAIARLQADVIHAHCFYYASVDAAATASIVEHVPFVLSPNLPLRAGMRWSVFRKVMRWQFRYAHATTVLSEFERALLVKSGLRPRRVFVVPPSLRRPGAAAAETALPWDPRVHRTLLFVGRVSEAKGVGTLVRALPLILRAEPEVRVALVGPLLGQDAERYRDELRRGGLDQHVWMAGEVSEGVLEALYQRSHVFVFPSQYEAYGIVVLEAMARGLPVVVSDAAALPEVVGHGARGLLHSKEDPAALAASVIAVLRDEDLRRHLTNVGLHHIRRNHSESALYDRLLEAYSAAREEASRRRRRFRPAL